MRVLVPQQILAGGWQLFWQQRRTWFDLAIIPLVWSMLIRLLLAPDLSAIMALDPQDPAVQGIAARLMGSTLLFIAASIVVWAMFASAWMRVCLALPPASAAPAGLSINATVRAVAAGLIKLMLICMAISLVAFMFAGTQGQSVRALSGLSTVALLASVPILVRLSMVLPAAAAGTSLGLGGAWRMTRGNWMRLLFSIGIAALGATFASVIADSFLIALVQGIFGSNLSVGPRLVLYLIDGLVAFATTAFLLAIVALCFRQLSGPGLQVVPTQRDSA